MPRIFAVQLKDDPAERYEQWVNIPVYTRDYDDCIGWLGCELPEDGYLCEFAKLAGDGAVTCASLSKINQLRSENVKLRELIAHYEHAVTVHDVKPVEVLEWSVRCDALRKELGIDVDE